MIRYLGNVQKCVDNFCAVPGTTLPESMKKLFYTETPITLKKLVGIEQLLDYMIADLDIREHFMPVIWTA